MERRHDESYFEANDFYGMNLLQRIASDIQSQEELRLVVPVAVIQAIPGETAPHHNYDQHLSGDHSPGSDAAATSPIMDRERNPPGILLSPTKMLRCLEAGAVDVLSSPLQKDRVLGLAVHAFRVHKEAQREQSAFLASRRMRKLSWVGTGDDGKPYAYLRESM